MKYHDPEYEKSEACGQCGKLFASKSYLKMHMKTHEKDRQRFECDICDKVYFSKASLTCHQRLHNGETVKCVLCPKEFVHQAEYKIHLRFHTNDYPFQCDKCGQKFVTKSHLNSHMKKHLGLKLRCNECGKVFGGLKGYNDHLFKHRGMPYICPNCKRGYPTKSKLLHHLRTTHSVEISIQELSKYCVAKPKKEMRTKLEWIKIEKTEES